MAFNNVEEVQNWPAKRVDNKRYDFSHLNAQRISYSVPANKDNPNKKYDVIITYSYHFFAKDTPEIDDAERQRRMYSYHGKALRPVHDERYELSKKLPNIIQNLLITKCLHGAKDSFFVVELISTATKQAEPYEVYFEIFKEMKKLRMHIKTAFVRRKRSQERAQKIKFATILNKTLANQKVKRPK